MADSKISALTELTTPNGTMEYVVNDAGTTKKISASNATSGEVGVQAMQLTDAYLVPVGLTTQSASAFTTAQGRMYASNYMFSHEAVINRIGIQVATAGTGSTVFRLGIYSGNLTEYGPENLILDAGTVDATITGEKEITISQTLQPGIYFTVAVAQTVTGTPASGRVIYNALGSSLGLFSTSNKYYAPYETGTATTGALPSTFPATTVSTSSAHSWAWIRRV